jgi:small-conductance mechanosensitive channel
MISTLESRLRDALDSVTTIAVGLAEALVIIFIARFIHRFLRDKLLHRLDSPNLSESAETLINVLSSVVVGLLTATLLLALWGVTWSGIFAALGLGTLGLLLGIQDVLKSLIGGLFLITEKPYSIGDRIQVRDITGRVIGIELRTTILRSDSGHRIVAPNSIVFTDTLTNFSMRRQIRTNLIVSGISGDPVEVRAKIVEGISDIKGVDGEVEVRFRARHPKMKGKALLQEGAAEPSRDEQTAVKNAEVWISWLGGGEPEVQAAVLAKLREFFPKINVRARTVKGIIAPHAASVRQT